MSSRNLLNLVLLVVVAVLVTVLIIDPGKKETPVIKLTKLSKSDINKIKIERPGAKTVVLEKKNDKWHMLKPYAMPADNFKANAISELAETKAKAHYPIKKGENLKPYGLAPARLSVTLNNKVKLEFGNIESLKYLRYIRENNTLYLIFDHFFSNISNPPAEFVDHKLLAGKPVITKLQLPKLTLTADGDKWQAQPPVKQLSNDQVNELLDNWHGAHATDILAYTPGKARVDAQARLYIKGQSKPLVFDIIHNKHMVSFARADIGLQYEFISDVAEDMLKLPIKIGKAKAKRISSKPEPGKK
ncbi:MAG: DUF4340 domain-containing protein [Gammaproteobacteria bacterium]